MAASKVDRRRRGLKHIDVVAEQAAQRNAPHYPDAATWSTSDAKHALAWGGLGQERQGP